MWTEDLNDAVEAEFKGAQQPALDDKELTEWYARQNYLEACRRSDDKRRPRVLRQQKETLRDPGKAEHVRALRRARQEAYRRRKGIAERKTTSVPQSRTSKKGPENRALKEKKR